MLRAPPCAAVSSPRTVMLPLNNHVGAKAECTFAFTADETAPAKLELLVDVALEGRHSNGIAKVTLMAAEDETGL